MPYAAFQFRSAAQARYTWCGRGFLLAIVSLALLVAPANRLAQAQPMPKLTGSYRSSTEHPRVFTTPSELQDLAKRIGTPGSYSSQRFSQLAGQIARDLAADTVWDATYSGCNIEAYLYAFSYEPHDAPQATRLRADLHLPASATPPAGAAVVASRLALYAALAKAGAPLPPNAPNPERAAELARRIVLAWGDHGFRDPNGQFRSVAAQFCGADGKVNPESMTQVGLQVSRGVVYSVHAQDLLMYVGALDADAAGRLDRFHGAMFELIRNALNYRFVDHPDWECNHYSNHVGSQLTGLLAVARLLDDKPRFEAALYGNTPSITVALPWTAYFDKAIYGSGAKPNACYANTGSDGLTSRPFFQTADVVPGEIDDRYRNANPLQGIGYAMATLQWLYNDAEILRIAGFDAYDYHGAAGQSIEAATRYYACYAKSAGFRKIINERNSKECQNFEQYDGKIVNGLEGNILRGVVHFLEIKILVNLELSAEFYSRNGEFSLDSIGFGNWRN